MMKSTHVASGGPSDANVPGVVRRCVDYQPQMEHRWNTDIAGNSHEVATARSRGREPAVCNTANARSPEGAAAVRMLDGAGARSGLAGSREVRSLVGSRPARGLTALGSLGFATSWLVGNRRFATCRLRASVGYVGEVL